MGFFRSLIDAEYGLVRANLQAYFAGRVSGLDHREALANMVRTRYRLGGDKLRIVSQRFDEVMAEADADPTWQLRSVIVEIYGVEVPERHANLMKLGEALDEGIAEWESRHHSNFLADS